MATAIYRLYFDAALWNNQDVAHNKGSAVTGVSLFVIRQSQVMFGFYHDHS